MLAVVEVDPRRRRRADRRRDRWHAWPLSTWWISFQV